MSLHRCHAKLSVEKNRGQFLICFCEVRKFQEQEEAITKVDRRYLLATADKPQCDFQLSQLTLSLRAQHGQSLCCANTSGRANKLLLGV